MYKIFVGKNKLLLIIAVATLLLTSCLKREKEYFPEADLSNDGEIYDYQTDNSDSIDLTPEIFVQMGHTSTGYTSNTIATFTPGGKYILSGNDDTTMKLWESATGTEIKSFRCLDDVVDIVVSPDGRLAISGSRYFVENIILWEIATGKKIQSFNLESLNGAIVRFCNDNKNILAGGNNNLLKLFDIESGKVIKEFIPAAKDTLLKPEITDLVLTPDGKKVIASYRYNGQEANDTSIRIWDLETGVNTLSFNNNNWTKALALTPDGTKILSGDWDDDSLRVWDINSGKQVNAYSVGGVSAIDISYGGRYALLGGSAHFSLFDLSTAEIIRNVEIGNDWVQSIKFSPDGKSALVARQVPQPMLYDLASGKQIRTFGGYAGQTTTAKLSQTNSTLMSAHGYSNKLVFWDYKRATLLKTIKNDSTNLLTSATMNRDGKLAVMAGWDMKADNSYISIWDYDKGQKLVQMSPVEKSGTHAKPAGFTTKNKQLIWGAGPNLYISETTSGKKLKEFSSVSMFGISKPTISLNEKYILCTDPSESLLLDAQTGQPLKTIKHPCAFSSDGNKVYELVQQSSKGIINIREIDLISMAEKELCEVKFESEIIHKNGTSYRYIKDVVTGVNSNYIFFNDAENIYKIDLAKRAVTATFQGHRDQITNLEVTPDGKLLCSSSNDGSTRFWNIETGKEVARFISFSDGEWIVITPEGYFNASENGAKYLSVRIGNRVYSIDNFYEKYYNPNMVIESLEANNPTEQPRLVQDIRQGVKLPPQVKIISPSNGVESKSETIEISISAQDMGGGIDEIRLYHNGKAVSEETRGIKIVAKTKQKLKNYTVGLIDGDNTFRAVAYSNDRTESNPSVINIKLSAPEKDVSLFVLTTGINKYKNPALNLNYAEPDAKGIADFFRKNSKQLFKNSYITDLYGEKATKVEILTQLKKMENSKLEDVVLVYLAGHGENINDKWYFIPYEVTNPEREDDLKSKAISSDELANLIKNIKAQKIILLIDACKSGAALVSFRGFEDRKALSQLSRSTGVHVIAASSKNQFATEVKELGHGVFTYTILEGLKGKAGKKDKAITIRNLMNFTEEQLPEISKKYKLEAQYPVVDSKGMDFPISKP